MAKGAKELKKFIELSTMENKKLLVNPLGTKVVNLFMGEESVEKEMAGE